MCGRYTLKKSKTRLAEHFGVDVPEVMRYNIAPSQALPVITSDAVKLLSWGFVPSWSKEPRVNFFNINARRETVATSNAYRGSFRRKRRLIPSDCFYKLAPGPPKHPHHFRLKSGAPFAFAGIWDHWGRDGQELETFALITTQANDVVDPVHGRMPMILRKDDDQAWLDLEATQDELLGLLGPLEPGLMEDYPVGLSVNKLSKDAPECVEPA